jgi:hypothetical protein
MDNRVAPSGANRFFWHPFPGFRPLRRTAPWVIFASPSGRGSRLRAETGVSAPERVQVILYFLAAFRLGGIYLHAGEGARLADCGIVFLAV